MLSISGYTSQESDNKLEWKGMLSKTKQVSPYSFIWPSSSMKDLIANLIFSKATSRLGILAFIGSKLNIAL